MRREAKAIKSILIAGACVALTGCSGEALKELKARETAMIDSKRIPEAKLTTQQAASLKKPSDQSRLAWARGGIQPDGKIFVCYVTTTPAPPTLMGSVKSALGEKIPDVVRVHAGSFNNDGDFKLFEALFIDDASFDECRNNGIDPPIRKVLTINGVRAN